MGEPQHQATKYHKNSALGAVFSSLCPAHQSLLYQILKLAHQHKLLFQPECYCCPCNKNTENHITPHPVTLGDWAAHNCCQHQPTDCDHCNTRHHPSDPRSNGSPHHYPLKEHRNETAWGSNSCSVLRCKRETCTIICPERVHCLSCQSLSSTNINNVMCSFTPTASSPSLCASPLNVKCSSLSVTCSQHNPQSCSCHLNHLDIKQEKSTTCTENGDSACLLLKREHSPSPPPLSPIPSDLNKPSDEKPPYLLYQLQEEVQPVVTDCLVNANHDKDAVKRRKCTNAQICQTKKTSGTLLQDVVNRYSEKLETIKPLDKDAPLPCASVAQTLPLNADAHLTEIITTVLHTGSASEYNLNELMNHHVNKEPKSPNTRSRRRQEVLTSMATPADDTTTRRHKTKGDLAMLDQSYNKHKRAKLKLVNNVSISNMVKEECVVEAKVCRLGQPPNMPATGTVKREVKDNIQLVNVTEGKKFIKKEQMEESHLLIQCDDTEMANCESGKNQKKDDQQSDSKNIQYPSYQSNNSRQARKSRRNIVPPPRFSSYVTEPRKMYFVACFSDTIFNQRSRKDEVITPTNKSDNNKALEENCASENTNCTNLFSAKENSKTRAIALNAKKNSAGQENSETVAGNKCGDQSCKRLQPEKSSLYAQTMPSTCSVSPPNSCVEYTSPIKLMFVSPVENEEGIKYSLKSAAAVNGSQADECFDPCEESSWSGTPEKNKSHSSMLALPKSNASPAKPASVSPRSSPSKISPTKSSPPTKCGSSPKSASLSPKTGSRRSGESTSNRVDDSQRSPCDALPVHEITPPKRRPGRPKKLGPQLEKTKRPIGRPRKDKAVESTMKERSEKGKVVTPDGEENVNKNLKITVLYGRSRRNKRMVSEGFDQLQTEFRDACQAVGLNNNWSMLMNTAQAHSSDLKSGSVELSQEIPLIRPTKDCASQSKTKIKCQSLEDTARSRKPGRPAKVKISGISVTVTTVSPRQRKIQINKDTKTVPVKLNHKRALLKEFVSAKEPKTIICHSVSTHQEQETDQPKIENKLEQPNPPPAVRHSDRVRKPSIHFLHAVATSSSYSRSSALVRRSKQVLLNRANSERKKEESHSVQTLRAKESLRDQKTEMTSSPVLQQIATVSVDSIYSPRETLKWWAASAQEKTLNQELARRIRLISDTWVSEAVDNDMELHCNKRSRPFSTKAKRSSVVRSLFDCSPNKPRSCSMQQLCSWFMQTTETQSLSIVKKASSRNPYELLHFPRSKNKKSICYSPQAERLRKHLKKFAKSVPKSPYDYKQAQRRMNKKCILIRNFEPWRTTSYTGKHDEKSKRKSKSFSKYQAILFQAKRRFLTRKERKTWLICRAQSKLNGQVTELQQKPKALRKLTKYLSCCGQEPVNVAKDYLSSKSWSPETLKECRVFLRKINSPDIEVAEEEWDSCTVSLDDGLPSALLFGKSDKTVKTEQIGSPKRGCLREPESTSPKFVQEPHVKPGRGRKGRHRVRVVSESTQPPPAKRLRQSRMMGLTGPRWRDFVFGN